MEQRFWFSLPTFLLLTVFLEIMGKVGSCISQDNGVIWRKKGQNVSLRCVITADCSDKSLLPEWYLFKENSNPLKANHKYNFPVKSGRSGPTYLDISSLQTNDSGIYYCAAVLQGKPGHSTLFVGAGTTLVVSENLQQLKYIILWLAFALLVIYSLVILTLILKKCGAKRMYKTAKTSSKKTQFREVLQEMYNRRNFDRHQQTVNRNHSQVEENSNINGSTDDIYQNV